MFDGLQSAKAITSKLTRQLAIANRLRINSAHKVTIVIFFLGGGSPGREEFSKEDSFLWGRNIWDTGGSSHCCKHKFQVVGVVFMER